MRRREFITLLGGAAAWPLASHGQQSQRMRRIGVLMPLAADDPEEQSRLDRVRAGLAGVRLDLDVKNTLQIFLGRRLDQFREKVQSLQADTGLYAVRS